MQAPHRPQATDRPQAIYDPAPVNFDTLGLEPSLLEGVAVRGWQMTTPIQSAVIPIVMNGDDLIGCADTGTGRSVNLTVMVWRPSSQAPHSMMS